MQSRRRCGRQPMTPWFPAAVLVAAWIAAAVDLIVAVWMAHGWHRNTVNIVK